MSRCEFVGVQPAQGSRRCPNTPLVGSRYCGEHDEDYPTLDSLHQPEMVEHPEHYGGDTVYEVIKVLEAWDLESDALLWNVVKYVARASKKDDLLQDLKKAQFYLDRRVKQLEDES